MPRFANPRDPPVRRSEIAIAMLFLVTAAAAISGGILLETVFEDPTDLAHIAAGRVTIAAGWCRSGARASACSPVCSRWSPVFWPGSAGSASTQPTPASSWSCPTVVPVAIREIVPVPIWLLWNGFARPA